MKKVVLFITLAISLLLSMKAIASDYQYHFNRKEEENRFMTLIQETRCMVCQHQNIADSNAPLAKDLRAKIYRMVIANQSDGDIKEYLVKRYGESILLRPRVNKLTFFLWTFPLIGLFCIAIFVRWMMAQLN